MKTRHILHVDMDCFFAAVEQRDRPELRGKPVIVGADPKHGRGVVSTASYEARRFGIRSGIPISEAYARCPHGQFVRGSSRRYTEASEHIMRIFYRYTPLVESISLDEAFLDVTGSERLHGPAVHIAQTIVDTIAREVRLPASVGVAPNKYLAKIASDLEKPRGFVVVDPERVQEFLNPIPIGRMWGVGPGLVKVFQEISIKTIGDLAQLPLEVLVGLVGKRGADLWRLARGLDDRPVSRSDAAKSVGHEITFHEDVSDIQFIKAALLDICEAVCYRLRQHNYRGKVATLKLRFADFSTFTRACQLPAKTHLTEEIFPIILQNLKRMPPLHQPVRLVGISMSHFDDPDGQQLDLWSQPERHDKLEAVSKAIDTVKDRYGDNALRRAAVLYCTSDQHYHYHGVRYRRHPAEKKKEWE